MFKKVILSAAAYLLHFSLGHADVDISKYALGMSNKSLHNQLVEDGFYFSYFDDEKITAVKSALIGRVPDEYGNIRPSTKIDGRFCNGKLYKLDFTSLYQGNQTNLLFGRKAIYQYLSDNKAAAGPFKINKNETSSLITHTYIIDRNDSGGQVRGEEKVIFAIDQSDLTSKDVPVLKIRALLENRWFCPE